MKVVLLYTLTLFLYIKSFGQKDFKIQYELIKSSIVKPYETLRKDDYAMYVTQSNNDTFFIDYMLRKYLNENDVTKFIANRYSLKKFTDIYLKQNAVRLSLITKDTIEINFFKEYINLNDIGFIKYDSTYTGKISQPNYEFKYIKSVDGKTAYGLTFDTNIVSRIKFISIKVNGKESLIDKATLQDLYFPNFCEVDYAIKPIEAFLSPDGNYIYLYIFGGQENHEFFTKIIYGIREGKTVGRMIADSKELGAYQCLSYKNFIGF